MNADVAATAAHKNARTTDAKTTSTAVVYNAVTAQGLVTFASVETRRSKVPVRAANKARGQVGAD
jgi:lipid-binding SYLF domain-containing protein